MSAWRAGVRRWHRRIGIGASLFLIWLAVSGVLLNESTRFGLDRARVATPWLMRWYGLTPTPPERGFGAGGHWLVETPDTTLLDGHALAQTLHNVIGLAAGGDGKPPLLFVAMTGSLALLTADGQPVETLDGASLPIPAIRRIGNTAEGLVAIQDLDVYTSLDGEAWKPAAKDGAILWSVPQPLPEAVRAAAASFSRPSLSLQRVLADAHSGRLFGHYGPLVIDIAALSAAVLAATGLWMVWRATQFAKHRYGH